MSTTTFERVEEILVEELHVPPAAVRRGASFEDLGIDSLAKVELGELLGDRFGVEVDDDEFAQLTGLDEVVAMLAGVEAE